MRVVSIGIIVIDEGRENFDNMERTAPESLKDQDGERVSETGEAAHGGEGQSDWMTRITSPKPACKREMHERKKRRTGQDR